MKTNLLILAALLVGGCGGKAPAGDDFSDFSLDVKSDAFTSKSKLVGTYSFGQKIPLVAYTKTPRYRMIGLDGQAGLTADIWVRSTDGDAVAWLLDDHKRVIASNDDAAEGNTTDAHIQVTLPQSKSWFLVIREYSLHKATFQIVTQAFTAPGGASSATQAYELAEPNLDHYVVDRTSLPKAAMKQYDGYATRLGAATAYAIPTDSLGTVFAVSAAAEEYYYVDVYDSSGAFVGHGESGDGGPEVNGWSATPFDPSSI